MPDVKTVLADPKFYELPEGERVKVIASLDNNFTALPQEEQLKVVTRSSNSNDSPTVPTENGTNMPYAINQAFIGAGKKLAGTAMNIGQMWSNPVQVAMNPEMGSPKMLEPSNQYQKYGGVGADILSFLAPMAGEAKVASATSKLPMVLRALLKGTYGAGTNAIISKAEGQSKEQQKTAATLGAISGPVAEATQAIANYTPRIINSLIKPGLKLFDFGKNPGKAVVEEGIVAGSKPALLSKISDKENQIGQQIDKALSTPQAQTQVINIEPFIDRNIDREIVQAASHNNQHLMDELNKLKTTLKQVLIPDNQGGIQIAGPRNLNVNPLDATKFKRGVAEEVRWVQDDGTPAAMAAKVKNKVLKSIYHDIDSAVDSAVPSSAELNSRYANLVSARKAVDHTMRIEQKHQMFSMPELVAAAGVGGSTGYNSKSVSEGGIAGIATLLGTSIIRKYLGSAGPMTAQAQVMAKLFPNIYGPGSAAYLGTRDKEK